MGEDKPPIFDAASRLGMFIFLVVGVILALIVVAALVYYITHRGSSVTGQAATLFIKSLV